uniref:Uncharacterized protein n=1 Tax=Rhabditophanes sp. KR3021 TaxID=114890 RepID=A0AC35U4H3_9BILA
MEWNNTTSLFDISSFHKILTPKEIADIIKSNMSGIINKQTSAVESTEGNKNNSILKPKELDEILKEHSCSPYESPLIKYFIGEKNFPAVQHLRGLVRKYESDTVDRFMASGYKTQKEITYTRNKQKKEERRKLYEDKAKIRRELAIKIAVTQNITVKYPAMI